MTPTAEPPEQTPEGLLLDQAMLRRHWKTPQLADAASVSVDWLRALRRGYRNVGKGSYEKVVPDAAMLATLAHALGNVTQDQLTGIGRSDAARALGILNGDGPRRTGGESVADRLLRLRDELDAIIGELRP